jgi:triacylglycerol esterase/lipase EstA (alpha/beta hydrolase family)
MKRTMRGLILLFVLAAAGCATPVGVSKLTQEQATHARTQSALTNGKPSPASAQFLYRLDLVERAKEDPEGTLAILHSGLGKADDSARLLALAELSFIYAQRSGNHPYDLAAAAYAWAFLFPEDRAKRPGGYDPRVALAIDIYDSAITKGLSEGDEATEVLDLSARSVKLPFGNLELAQDAAGFLYGKSRLTEFVPLANFKVRGLRNRYRQPGLGAALAANASRTGDNRLDRWLPLRGQVPVTLLLRFDNPRQGMAEGNLRATIEVHNALADPNIQIDGQDIPLEADFTAALAYRLEGAPVWDFAVAGFRSGETGSFFKTQSTDVNAGKGLFMLEPYAAGRIPIVFVHGTASSPARWAQMVNEIMGDPELARKYQCWLFIYNTGNPIAYSALRLREALTAVIEDVDPQHEDDALRRMVVIGHSQGGLLTKMLVVDSGDKFWDNISKVPFDQAKLSPETRDVVRRALFVKPLPFVKRVIFIATPHRGSFLANNWLGNLGRRLINLPGNLVQMGGELTAIHGKDPLIHGMATSVDNMKSSNPFLATLSSMPIAPGVYVNSIIAVKGDGPAAQGNDGVVEFQSAHIEPVESEFLVKSGHSTQGTPPTIEEVRRILYLNLDEP